MYASTCMHAFRAPTVVLDNQFDALFPEEDDFTYPKHSLAAYSSLYRTEAL